MIQSEPLKPYIAPIKDFDCGSAERKRANTPSAQLGGMALLVANYFVLAVLLVLVSDVASDASLLFYVAKAVIALLLFATLLLPIRGALLLFLLLAVVGSDVGTADVDRFGNVSTTAAIWQSYLGPIRPSWIIFCCVLLQFIKVKVRVVPPLVSRAALWFLTVPFLTAVVYGGFGGPNSEIEFVVDLKFIIMLVACLVLFLSTLRKHADFSMPVLAVLISGLCARHLVDLVYVVFNIGPEINAGVSQGSLDSAKGLVVFLAYLGVVLVVLYKRWLVGSLIFSASIFLLAAYSTRMLWITFVIGLIVLLTSLNLRRRALLMCVAVILFFVGGAVLSAVNPESAGTAYLRFLTITEGREFEKFDVDVDANVISRIDPTRYAEMLNILSTTSERYAFLWGSGYGGYYNDNATPFVNETGTTFADYSFATGRFYRAHDYVLHVFFKFGLIGLVLISSLWIVPGLAALSYLRSGASTTELSPLTDNLMRCLVAFLPTSMLQLYWSGKGLFFSGVLIALCMDFVYKVSSYKARMAERGQEGRPF